MGLSDFFKVGEYKAKIDELTNENAELKKKMEFRKFDSY